MIHCITLIIIVALICTTRIYPLWLRHDCKRYRKENAQLHRQLKDTYDEWLNDFGKLQKQVNDIFDKLFGITNKLQKS